MIVQVRLDRIPEKARQKMFGFLGQAAKHQNQEPAPKTAKQQSTQKLAEVLGQEANRMLLTFVGDGKELTAAFGLEAKQHECSIDVSLQPKANTRLAEMIDQLGNEQ